MPRKQPKQFNRRTISLGEMRNALGVAIRYFKQPGDESDLFTLSQTIDEVYALPAIIGTLDKYGEKFGAEEWQKMCSASHQMIETQNKREISIKLPVDKLRKQFSRLLHTPAELSAAINLALVKACIEFLQDKEANVHLNVGNSARRGK